MNTQALQDFVKRNIPADRSLPSEDLVSKYAKLYTVSVDDKYSSLVMLVQTEGANPISIASVYGQFDHAILGGSFNIPSEVPTTAVPMDLSLKQMTAFTGDKLGEAFFKNPNAPPACIPFNYAIMTMDVKDGKFQLKPMGWKTGQALYDLDVKNMTPLPLENLSKPDTWCKAMVNRAGIKTHLSSGMTRWVLLFILVAVACILIFRYRPL